MSETEYNEYHRLANLLVDRDSEIKNLKEENERLRSNYDDIYSKFLILKREQITNGLCDPIELTTVNPEQTKYKCDGNCDFDPRECAQYGCKKSEKLKFGEVEQNGEKLSKAMGYESTENQEESKMW